MGYAKTAVLMAAMTALFIGLGALLGGQAGAVIALVLAGAMNIFGYWNSDRMVLSMHGAREVDAQSAPEFHALVESLAHRAGLPMPRTYLIDTEQPNAFATGRDPAHAAVAATTGLMAALSREELAGVIAHELAHVRHRDTLIMTVTATFAGAIAMLANFAFFFRGGNRNGPGLIESLAMMILAPLAAGLVQMAISRAREYEADRLGAEICGQPMWLASALSRIEALAQRVDNPAAERHPATAHMFIINPLHALPHDRLFATHPSTENRIARLRAIAETDAAGDTGGIDWAGDWAADRAGDRADSRLHEVATPPAATPALSAPAPAPAPAERVTAPLPVDPARSPAPGPGSVPVAGHRRRRGEGRADGPWR